MDARLEGSIKKTDKDSALSHIIIMTDAGSRYGVLVRDGSLYLAGKKALQTQAMLKKPEMAYQQVNNLVTFMIDIRTVILSYIISNAICTIVIASVWIRHRKHFDGLGFWLADFAIQFIALLLAISRGVLPDFLSLVMPNVLLLTGTILMLMGLERFVGKRAPHLHNYILLAVFSGVHSWFTLVQPSQLNLAVNFSLALMFVLTQSAWLMFRRVEPDLRPATRGVGTILLSACSLAMARLVMDLIVHPENDFYQFGLYDTLYILANQMLFIGLTFGLVLMVNRRLMMNMESDIAQRKQAEETLRANEALYHQMFTEHSAVKLLIDPSSGNIVDANPAASSYYGYPSEALLRMNIGQINTLSRDEIARKMQDVRNQSKNHFIFQHRLASGEVRDVEVNSVPIQVGERQLLHSIIHDVTERKLLEESLRNHNNVMAALNQAMLDLVDRHKVDDILQALLVRTRILLDAPHVSIDLLEKDDALITYAATPGQPLEKGDRMRRGEGGWLSWQAIESGQPAILDDYSTWPRRRELYKGFPIHAIAIIPIHQRERVIGAINFSRNTANKPFNETDIYVAQQLAQMVALVLDNAQLYAQLQSELAESVQREQTLQQAQAQVIDQHRLLAIFDERQRMARDLHDSVNQSIHSLVLFSETLVSTLDKNNLERARQISERLQESARQALKETRLLLYQTQASVNGSVNLFDELSARLANVELRAGVRGEMILEGSQEHCPQEWHENLFWITIEALNNSLKHAQARNVQIVIRSFPKFLELAVMDDGKGFDTTRPRVGGYGLRNMQERADLLGGKITFISAPANGASVLFRAERAEVRE